MKQKLFFFFGLFLIQNVVAQQNLILNPSFENGIVPKCTGLPYFIDQNVPNWKGGCNYTTSTNAIGSPDIFQATPNDKTYGVPENKWANNLPVNTVGPIGSKRYVGFAQSESVVGEISGGALLANVNYNISLYASISQKTTGETPVIQVVLRNSSNICGSELVVFTPSYSPISGVWSYLSGSFTLTAAQALQNYDRIEFRQYLGGSAKKPVFIDDVKLSRKTIQPEILTTQTEYCSGTNFTFTGQLKQGSGSCSQYLWEVVNCNADGSVLNGAPWVSNWFQGNPSSSIPFTFPTSGTFACDTYYRVALTCYDGTFTYASKVIHVTCITTNNNPNFSQYYVKQFTGNTFGSIAVLPDVPSEMLAPGFVEEYTVERLNASGDVVRTLTNPISSSGVYKWHNLVSPYVVAFKGYNYSSTSTNCFDSYSNWDGKFALNSSTTTTANTSYRITRKTKNAVCNTFVSASRVFVINPLIKMSIIDNTLLENEKTQDTKKEENSASLSEDKELLSSISIYPNPTNGIVKIEINNSSIKRVIVKNVVGKIIAENEISEKFLEIDLSDYPAGIYLVNLHSENGNVLVRKVIKN